MYMVRRFAQVGAFMGLMGLTVVLAAGAEPTQSKGRLHQESRAVSVARAHVEAWSNHNYDKVRQLLTDDVHVITTTTQPVMGPDVNTTGIDEYMRGLKKFADSVDKGSARVLYSTGDDNNALLIVSALAAFGPGPKMTLTAARLYLLDQNGKIKSERVIFFSVPQ